MRKIYSFVAFVVMMIVSLAANAWSFDMTNENAVLQSEQYNYRLYKSYDFWGGNYNGQSFTNEAGETVSGDGCFTVSADKASFKLNGFDAFQVLAPVEMNNFFIQIGTGAINLRAGVSKDGLHNYGSGSRFFCISDVKAGQIIVCQWGVTTSRASVVQPGTAITDAACCAFEDVSEEIHAIQAATAVLDEEGNVIEGGADNFSYWRATSDGNFVIEMQRDCAIQGLQIWIDASASEAVSAPVMSMASVNHSARGIDFKPGESTFGNPCTSYYITEEDKEMGIDYPLFLKETEEIVKTDTVYTYQMDEEGNFVLDEEGNKVVESVEYVNTYKLVMDEDAVAEAGQAGEHPYNAVDGLSIDQNADIDGDGYVTIWAQTLSESGAFSDVVELRVSVGEIQLNAPTLTLQALDGVNRTYSIGWTNNTLCKEDYAIKVEGDNGEILVEFEPNTGIGELVSAKQNLKVTVSVNGYAEGIVEQDVVLSGTDFKRKNTEVDAEGNIKHDWDFVNLSDEQQKIIRGEVMESCYIIVDGDSLVFTPEEFENGISNDQAFDLSSATPNYKPSCWWWDGSRSRATLNVNSDTIVDRSLLHDFNANGYGYVEDEANVYHDLAISCPANANNASCLFMYINGDLGTYFMAKPTITFSPEKVKAGEYVLIYQGAGGSNYTNWRSPALYEVPAGELLSVTLASGGIHVFYIDIYTYDGIADGEDLTEQWNQTVAVEGMKTVQPIVGYYSANGAKIAAPQKGINVVKYADGTTMKILVK